MIKSHRSTAPLLVPALVLGAQAFAWPGSGLLRPAVANDFGSKEAAQAYYKKQREAPLRAAGIDPDLDEALVAALNNDSSTVQLAAIELVKQRRIPEAAPALRQLLADQTMPARLFKLFICEALAAIQPWNSAWRRECASLLQDSNPMVRIRAAGLLAEHGDAQGWAIVRENLFSGAGSRDYEAAAGAPFFNGLTLQGARGPLKLDVLSEVLDNFRRSSGHGQGVLQSIISALAEPQDIPRLREAVGQVKEDPMAYSVADSLQQLIRRLEALEAAGQPKAATPTTSLPK